MSTSKMGPRQREQAESLIQKWRVGEEDAWVPLRALIEKRIQKNAGKIFKNLEPGQAALIEEMIPKIFDRLLARNIFDFANRDGFHGMCAHAMRHILVEIYRDFDIKEPDTCEGGKGEYRKC